MLDAENLLLMLSLLWPMALLASVAVPQWRPRFTRLLPLAAVPALLLSTLSPSGLEHTLGWLMLGVSFGIDEISSVFLLVTSLLWIAGSLLITKPPRTVFSVAFLLTMIGSFSVLLARDIPTFFLGYALMSLATFALIFDSKSANARYAARAYLVFAMLGEMVLLTALIMVAHNTGTIDIEHIADRHPDDLLITLLLIGFGIKSGIPLLHLALPPVYAALPAAAAVPVAGGLLHLGLYGWLRFLPLEYPQQLIFWSHTFLLVGMAGILYGFVGGLLQQNPRSLLAYSSISQMGLMTMLLALMLAQPQHRELISAGILLFVLHHALIKGALFHGLAVHGYGHWSLWFPALSLAAAPLTGGAIAKGLLKVELTTLPGVWPVAASAVVIFSSIATSLLMARFFYLSVHKKHSERAFSYRWGAHAGWWILLAAAMSLPWLWPLQLDRAYDFWSALWPLLIGVVIAGIAFRFRDRLSWVPLIPPGDLLVPLEKLVRQLIPQHRHHAHHPGELDAIVHPKPQRNLLTRAEITIGSWTIAMTLLILVMLTLYRLL